MSCFDLIFENYVVELRSALADANEWYERLLAKETAMTGSLEIAQENITERWPFNSPTHPYVLAVYRKYYHIVTKENDRIISSKAWEGDEEEPEDELFCRNVPHAPWIILFDGLHGRHDDLVDALSWIVYEPIGLDEEGNISI